jgi:YspA, cpYpsA-related SLOG family
MRVIVTGDRAWYCAYLSEEIVGRLFVRYGPSLVIVNGGATGIDRSFAEACGDLGVEQEAHPARWAELDATAAVIRYDKRNRPYNVAAGPRRNAEMIAAGAEMGIAFHRAISSSSSKGTKDCARQAIEAGIPTYLINSEAADPKRLLAGDERLR